MSSFSLYETGNWGQRSDSRSGVKFTQFTVIYKL